jgi:hypothetical protein
VALSANASRLRLEAAMNRFPWGIVWGVLAMELLLLFVVYGRAG